MRGLFLALAALAVSVSAETKFTRTVTKIKCDNGCSTATVTYTTGLYTPRTARFIEFASDGRINDFRIGRHYKPTHTASSSTETISTRKTASLVDATRTATVQTAATGSAVHHPVVSQIQDGQVQGLAHTSGIQVHVHTPSESQSSSKSELKHTVTTRVHKTATLSLSHPATISGVWYPTGNSSKTNSSTVAKDTTIMTGAAASASWSGLVCLVIVAAFFVWA